MNSDKYSRTDDNEFLTKYRNFSRKTSYNKIPPNEKKTLLEKYSKDALEESNSSILAAVRYRHGYSREILRNDCSKASVRDGYAKDKVKNDYSKGRISNDFTKERSLDGYAKERLGINYPKDEFTV